MNLSLYLRRLWAALRGRDPLPTLPQEMKMALADDILALLPKFQAAVAGKDEQIAALTTQVTDLQKQIADGETAVLTLTNEIAPAPSEAPVA